MVFDYYSRLTAAQKAIYRKSDKIERITLNDVERLRPWVAALADALRSEKRGLIQQAAEDLIGRINHLLQAPSVRVRVLSARPSHNWGELHGLYEPDYDGGHARMTVWMRTARHKKVVAFRTFLRTLLHELCHHLDYELYELPDSFHTEGFFKRESSLFKQLVPDKATGKQ